MTTSPTSLGPEPPIPEPEPLPPPPVRPTEPVICVDSLTCEPCGTPTGVQTARLRGLGWRTAQAALRAAAPMDQGPDSRAGAMHNFRVNPTNGRLRTAASPPTSGGFEVTPGFYYNSSDLGATEYGFGWTGTFRRKVTQISGTAADLSTEAGNVLHYTGMDGSGLYVAPGRARNGLKKNGNGTWTETAPNGFRYQYDTNGLLASMENYRGTAWAFSRDGGGRVTSVTGPFSSVTSIVYDVRARYYDVSTGRWLSQDLLEYDGNTRSRFEYSRNCPISITDPSGRISKVKPRTQPTQPVRLAKSDSLDCCGYRSTDHYTGAAAGCFCQCAGDSLWAQYVRGCLRDLYDKQVSPREAHATCYELADQQGYPGGRPVTTLIVCYAKCHILWAPPITWPAGATDLPPIPPNTG